MIRLDMILFVKELMLHPAEITVIGEYEGEAVELKMRKKLFYSPRGKNPNKTQDVKMKTFSGMIRKPCKISKSKKHLTN